MALSLSKDGFFLLLASMAFARIVQAGDPDITSDFIFPPNTIAVNESFFTHTGFRNLVGAAPPAAFKVTKATLVEFPALSGQSVSYALLQFPAGAINPPHLHPRSAELLFIMDGCIEVGLIDTTNKLFVQTLQKGDMFLFPKGLVHYLYNINAQYPAVALSAFGSANAGSVSIPGTIFASGITDDVLTKSFKTEIATIQKLKAGLVPNV
ncbi:hypothetical protein HHK36_019357 [Tetracentron sinense]|uniref:Germin-like protein n=1 Tax=Tetracentron sinense TaxID=13715 RepID=A0A834YZ35_TETSI|nr:hypothetical protein HHK36_019357 [Tetracentron sinense]